MNKIWIHIIPAILSTFLLQIILHELGHMVFGIVTDWKLTCLQVHKWVIVKKSRSYTIRYLDTGCFQCIMYPRNLDNNAVLYTLGGSLFNMIGAFVGILGMILFNRILVLWIYAWSFVVSAIILALVNLIPNTKRVCNDGACFKLLKSDKLILSVHNSQMLIAKQLYEGRTYQQIENQTTLLASEYTDNDILAYQAVLEYYYWMEAYEYEKMQQAIGKVVISSSISRNVSDIILMEKLYIDLLLKIMGKDESPVDIHKYNNDMSLFIKTHEINGDVHTLRVKAVVCAYEKLVEGDLESAIRKLDDAILLIEKMNCLYLGEKRFCARELRKMKEFLNAGTEL